MNKKLMMIALTVVAVGCSNDKKSEGGGGGTSLEFKQNFKADMIKYKPLTTEQKTKVSKWLKTSNANLPSTNLILNKYEDWTKREEDLAKLNADGKLALNKMKEKCIVGPQTDSHTYAQAAGESEIAMQAESISGENCAISHSKESIKIFTYAQVDKANHVYSGAGSYTYSIKGEVLDKELAQKAMLVKIVTSIKSNLIGENFSYGSDGKINQGAFYEEGSGTGITTIAEGVEVKTKISYENLKKPGLEKEQAFFIMHFDGFDFVLAVFLNNGKKEIFVNGTSYSEEDFEADFAMNL